MVSRRGPAGDQAGPLSLRAAAVPAVVAALLAQGLAVGCARYEPGTIPEAESWTRDAAWDGDVAISPDRRWVAFASERGGHRGLHVRPFENGDLRTLVEGAGEVSRPTWSPDGTRVLFTRADSAGTASHLFLIALEGGAVRPLGVDTQDASDGVFSPDGETVACVLRGDSTSALATVRLADFAVRPLVSTLPPPTRPVYTPKGETIVYAQGADLWAIAAEGGVPVALTPGPAREKDPAVSPDGRWLAFASDSTGYDHIWLARIVRDRDGRLARLDSWRPVTSGFQHHRRPVWDPRGRELWFERRARWDVVAAGLGEARADTLTSSLFDGTEPSYSPDGMHVVFSSNRSGNDDLWIMAAAGEAASGPARALVQHAGSDRQPDWSKASGQIVYVSERGGNVDLYLTDPEGNDLGRLTDDSSPDSDPRWSPDGRSIAFVSERDGNPEVYVLEGVGRAVHAVTAGTPGGARSPTWTADGTSILFDAGHGNRRAVWRVAAGGGVPMPLTTDDVPGSWDAWPMASPDGGRVVFTRMRRGDSDLWMLDLTTGEARPAVENPLADEEHADWFPDGRRLVYQSGGAVDLFRADVRPLLRR